MTWPLHTFFKALLTVAAAGTLVAGSVSGRVELHDSQDAAVRKHMDYSGVVVWLEPIAGPVPVASANAAARMIQKDKTFTPHVLAIRTGTSVDFPNFDPIFHNAFSNYNGKLFDVGLYPPGSSRRVRFSRAGIVRVFCNIHASMSAVIVVAMRLTFRPSAARMAALNCTMFLPANILAAGFSRAGNPGDARFADPACHGGR